ncbi:MAG TPA: hypothetical protein VGD60_02740 [Candidatus Acidoferrales bacterium]
MGRSLWDTASGRDRRWSKRGGGYPAAPGYARVVIMLLAVVLVGTLAWQGIQALLHPAPKYPPVNAPGNANYVARAGTSGSGATPAWQADVAGAMQAATAQGTAGNVTAAEVEVDRAASIVMSARMQGQKPTADFYVRNIAALDSALKTQPDNARMLEHVTLARMELADLRSADDSSAGNAPANPDDAPDLTSYPGASATPISNVGPDAEARHAKSIPGHVVMSAPRAISAEAEITPGTAGGNYLDATLMPETSEVLLPPATRKLSDGVRVEGLTIEGASQTLDGVRWRNVTFVGMRLRYEGGEISMENVKFVRCRFGFTTDERGAKLADAIALGKTSIEIQ